MSGAMEMGGSRGDVGKASEAGDAAVETRCAGNGGTGGAVCTIRSDGADASVFYDKMHYVEGDGNELTTY
jgi:hypothetical protein